MVEWGRRDPTPSPEPAALQFSSHGPCKKPCKAPAAFVTTALPGRGAGGGAGGFQFPRRFSHPRRRSASQQPLPSKEAAGTAARGKADPGERAHPSFADPVAVWTPEAEAFVCAPPGEGNPTTPGRLPGKGGWGRGSSGKPRRQRRPRGFKKTPIPGWQRWANAKAQKRWGPPAPPRWRGASPRHPRAEGPRVRAGGP